MTNLLVLIGAVLVAARLIGPALRAVISLLVSLVGAFLVVTLAIIVIVGVLMHGRII